MKKKADILKDIERLHHAVMVASEHFDVYHGLSNEKYRKEYTDTMNRYLGFFDCTISAHFTAFLLCLTKVFDGNKKNKRVSFYTVLDEAYSTGNISECAKEKINGELDNNDLKTKVTNLSILRNNHFAHLVQLNHVKAFREAGVSPNDLRNVIEKAKEIVNLLAYEVDRNSFAFCLEAKTPTLDLLHNLKQYHDRK